MAGKVAIAVFVIPIVFSFVFGSAVLADVLQEPDRELDMWQIKSSGPSIVTSKSIKIIGLESQYSTSDPVEIQVQITDAKFDCGDMYITIYDISSSAKQVFTQSGFFDQCYENKNLMLPVDDEFSEIIDTAGSYEILVEMNDKSQKDTISVKAKFSVR
jgi:hypothetical protein